MVKKKNIYNIADVYTALLMAEPLTTHKMTIVGKI